jgi:hypothetical protein
MRISSRRNRRRPTFAIVARKQQQQQKMVAAASLLTKSVDSADRIAHLLTFQQIAHIQQVIQHGSIDERCPRTGAAKISAKCSLG